MWPNHRVVVEEWEMREARPCMGSKVTQTAGPGTELLFTGNCLSLANTRWRSSKGRWALVISLFRVRGRVENGW